jgi:hypothetical protein
MLVPITSIIRGCPNKAGRSNFDKNKIAISLTVKMSEALRYGRLHSSSLGLINFDDSLTNYEIRQEGRLCLLSHIFGGLSICVFASKLDQSISMSLLSEQMSRVASTVLSRSFVVDYASMIQRK